MRFGWHCGVAIRGRLPRLLIALPFAIVNCFGVHILNRALQNEHVRLFSAGQCPGLRPGHDCLPSSHPCAQQVPRASSGCRDGSL